MAGEELIAYYAGRAHEYEQVYAKPERQADLSGVRAWVRDALAGHHILEVACGTGYWTAEVAPAALAVVATDATSEVLPLARQKHYPAGRVSFVQADAYALDHIPGTFTAGFAAFWWSHVPLERQAAFLVGLHRRIGVGSTVVFLDNRFVAGSSTPLSRRDATGNTYQRRRLTDGAEYEVLKNFPSRAELEAVLSPRAQGLRVTEFAYYWGVCYRVAPPA